jgi:hypothetical protein
MKSLFYRDMVEGDIANYKIAVSMFKIGLQVSEEAARYLKHIIDCNTMVSSPSELEATLQK